MGRKNHSVAASSAKEPTTHLIHRPTFDARRPKPWRTRIRSSNLRVVCISAAKISFQAIPDDSGRGTRVPSPGEGEPEKLPNEPILEFSIRLQTKEVFHKVSQPPRQNEPILTPSMGLDRACPYPSGILTGMNQETNCQGARREGLSDADWGTSSERGSRDECRGGAADGNANFRTFNSQHSTLNIETEIPARGPADGVHARHTFDAVKASRARSDLIKATIIFFGLDGECPS